MGFIVHTVRETGTITYHCPTPHTALEKVHAFRLADYWDITVRDCHDMPVSEGMLVLLVNTDGASRSGH